MDEYRSFDVQRGEPQLDGDHPLTGRHLQVLEDALVPGIVGNHEAEALGGGDPDTTLALDGELPPMISEGVDGDNAVLTGLHDLIEIADPTLQGSPGEGTVN